jgi:ABC-type multidrug transport system ATPase subunit
VAEEVPVLLLDEPTANLDPRARADFVQNLRRVPAETTVLLSSHRLEDVRAVASRVLVLHEGRIAFDGSIDELLASDPAGHTLWISTPEIDQAARILSNDRRARELLRNGVRVGVRTRPGDIADLLGELARSHVRVDGVDVEFPTLDTLLEGEAGASAADRGGSE